MDVASEGRLGFGPLVGKGFDPAGFPLTTSVCTKLRLQRATWAFPVGLLRRSDPSKPNHNC